MPMVTVWVYKNLEHSEGLVLRGGEIGEEIEIGETEQRLVCMLMSFKRRGARSALASSAVKTPLAPKYEETLCKCSL